MGNLHAPSSAPPSGAECLLAILRCWSALCLVGLLLVGCEVIPVNGLFDAFPHQIATAGPQPLLLVQKPGYFALHGEPLPREKVVLIFEPERIAVLPGAPSAPLAPTQSVSPVYAPQGSDSLAVPTGQLFIRFRQGETVAAHRAELEQAGCVIVQELDYAPEAAWLRARSGRIAEALDRVSRLRAMADVESVEPQLLMRRVHR
jgi:hypothetical protein